MKLLILLISTLFCLTQALPTFKNNHYCNIVDSKNATQLLDLSIDCQLLILEQLPLHELITIGSSNEHFLILSSDVFRRKFSKRFIKLEASFSNEIVDRDELLFQNLEITSKLLHFFGHLISRLKVKYESGTSSSMRIINKLINTYCSESLIEFRIDNSVPGVFSDYQNPFKNVKNVTIEGMYDNLDNSKLVLSEIFPSVNRMSISNLRVENPSSIIGIYQSLEYIDVETCDESDENCFTESIIMKFIENNPNIRELKLRFVTRKLLKFVAEHLKQLEHLHIAGYRNDANAPGDIHFENLLSFTMTFGIMTLPSNIFFDRLVEFHSDTQPRSCPKWIQLVESSKTLRKLRISGGNIRDEQVQRLARAHLDLTDIEMVVGMQVADETLVELINSMRYLKKVELVKFSAMALNQGVDPDTVDILRRQFGDEWRIDTSKFTIFMEKIV